MSGILVVAGESLAPPQSEAAAFARGLARALGAAVLSLATDEAPRAAWLRALEETRPRAVLIHSLGALSPEALLDLRAREIRYALYWDDYAPVCPTHRLWHASEDNCAGPAWNGWKCALCVANGPRRWPALPALWRRFRGAAEHWRAALAGADAVITPSRYLRDGWISRGLAAERVLVAPPLVPARGENAGGEVPTPASARGRDLVFVGGWEQASGAMLLAEALNGLEQSVRLEVVAPELGERETAAARAAWREAVPARHELRFHAGWDATALDSLLASAAAAVAPARWRDPFGGLIERAQRLGAPPVATAVGGRPERIIHGLNGFLSDPDDPTSLAAALGDALDAHGAGGWDAAAAAAHVEREARESLEKIRRLLLGLEEKSEHAAARAEHGAAMAALRAEFGRGEEAAFAHLRSALEAGAAGTAETSDPVDAAAALLAAAERQDRRVLLNHALALFHRAGARRILCLGGGVGDAARWFASWGRDARSRDEDATLQSLALRLGASTPTPDFSPQGIFLDRRATADLDFLRRRYPQALAIVALTPSGVEVL